MSPITGNPPLDLLPAGGRSRLTPHRQAARLGRSITLISPGASNKCPRGHREILSHHPFWQFPPTDSNHVLSITADAAAPVGAVALQAIVGANSAANRLYLPCPGSLNATAGSRQGAAVKYRSLVGGLSAATLATGLLLVGSSPVSQRELDA